MLKNTEKRVSINNGKNKVKGIIRYNLLSDI